MDVAMGKMDGTRTFLVSSGITGHLELESIPERRRPDAVLSGVAGLLDWL
jgi:ribonucleotide monophosphatase NagD (HAD superfamily)